MPSCRRCAAAALCFSWRASRRRRDCDLLIEAFAKVAGLVPEMDLVIAGPDQVGWQAKLERQAEKLGIGARVHWPGLLGGDLKWGALRACEVFVLPSHQENFGIGGGGGSGGGAPGADLEPGEYLAGDRRRPGGPGGRGHAGGDRAPAAEMDRDAGRGPRRDGRPRPAEFHEALCNEPRGDGDQERV